MRILVTGAGGLLGGRLAPLLTPLHETTVLVRNRPGPEGFPSVTADLTDQASVEAALGRSGAEVVVHCAALADAEICERDKDRARRDNEEATRCLAAACRLVHARLILISTDLVFSGERSFSAEASPARPITEYGRSKLRAEEAAFEEVRDAVVLRVALLHGLGNGPRLSASEGVAQRLLRREPVTLFEDEWRTPLDPESVAAAIELVLRRPGAKGRFHLGGPERLTRLDFGRRVATTLGLDASWLRPSRRASHQGAPRPEDVSLDSTRARVELGWEPRPLDLGIRAGRTL